MGNENTNNNDRKGLKDKYNQNIKNGNFNTILAKMITLKMRKKFSKEVRATLIFP